MKKNVSLQQMKEEPISYYYNDERVAQVIDYLGNKKDVFCDGIVGSAKSMVAASVFKKMGGRHFLVCPDKESAAYFYNDLENLFGEREMDYSNKMILFYPTSYKRPYEPEKPDNTYILSRVEVLQRFSSSERKTMVVSYPEALSERIVTRKALSDKMLKLSVREKVDLDFVTDALLELNFEHVDFVVEPGQFAVRGGIVDVFSFANDYPYRIVFDFDEVADFFERIGVFRSDEGNDVSDVFRHFAFADHDIPVLFNVANFVVGNVFSGQDFDAIGVLESL